MILSWYSIHNSTEHLHITAIPAQKWKYIIDNTDWFRTEGNIGGFCPQGVKVALPVTSLGGMLSTML